MFSSPVYMSFLFVPACSALARTLARSPSVGSSSRSWICFRPLYLPPISPHIYTVFMLPVFTCLDAFDLKLEREVARVTIHIVDYSSSSDLFYDELFVSWLCRPSGGSVPFALLPDFPLLYVL